VAGIITKPQSLSPFLPYNYHISAFGHFEQFTRHRFKNNILSVLTYS
jgi:hypothetical protein